MSFAFPAISAVDIDPDVGRSGLRPGLARLSLIAFLFARSSSMRPLSRYLAMSAFIISASVLFSLHTVADKPVPPSTDSRLSGVWVMQSGVNQGQPIPNEQTKGSQMIVRGDSIAVNDKDEAELYRCTYKFDAAVTPNLITMTSTMPGRSESQVLGIYKIEGETLTLCYALPGGKRPSEFRSTADGKTMLFQFKRSPGLEAGLEAQLAPPLE